MAQEQRASAVGADAVLSGVTSNAEFFDQFSMQTHGIGQRHDVATCTEPACGHPDHGGSTAGKNFENNERAGDMYDGEGSIPVRIIRTKDMRTGEDGERFEANTARDGAYNPEVSHGGDEAITAIEHDPDTCEVPRCRRCNEVIEAMLQPDYSISKGGGGGSSGRKRKAARPITGPERIERHLFGGTPFDEGHTSGNAVGRPRKGSEARRDVLAGRVEPRDKNTLDSACISTADILAGYAAAIRMARSGVAREIIAAGMIEMVEQAAGDEGLPESA